MRWAVGSSLAGQYAALAAFVVAEALLFVSMLYLADRHAPGAIASAALELFASIAMLFWYVLRLLRRFGR